MMRKMWVLNQLNADEFDSCSAFAAFSELPDIGTLTGNSFNGYTISEYVARELLSDLSVYDEGNDCSWIFESIDYYG